MKPDFSKATVEVLAKRAGYSCSNPDCRVRTVGPNTDPNKATNLGEAAHIFGAREKAKRYNSAMTDTARASITNGIWLCRNCHKLIDSDEQRFSTELIFVWREQHETYIQSELGNKTDRIYLEQQNALLDQFESYPPIIKRIVIDKPDCWEFMLSAELMRHLNKGHFRKLSDLRKGIYIRPMAHVNSDDAFNWVQSRVAEMSRMIEPMVSIVSSLNSSWGESGEPGDANEIHHVTERISEYLEQIIIFEESLYFTVLPDEYEGANNLLKNTIGSQVDKLASMPKMMDGFITAAEAHKEEDGPLEIQEVITFEVSEEWADKLTLEMKKATGNAPIIENGHISLSSIFWWILGILFLIMIFGN